MRVLRAYAFGGSVTVAYQIRFQGNRRARGIIRVTEGQPAEHVKEIGTGIVIRPGDYETLVEAIYS